MMTGDASRFDIVLAYIEELWRGPLEAVVFGYFLYQEIGYYGLIGVGFILSFIPLQSNVLNNVPFILDLVLILFRRSVHDKDVGHIPYEKCTTHGKTYPRYE